MRTTLLLIGLCCSVALAEPRAAQFRIQPSGAVLLDRDTQQEVARAPLGTFDWTAETDTVHHYRIERPPFDTQDLTLQWDTQRWRVQLPTRQVWLDSSLIVGLSRTVQINTKPSDADVYVDTEAANAEQGESLEVAGISHKVLRLGSGTVVVPNGWVPPVLYLVRPGFEAHMLQIPEGALDTDSAVYPPVPVALHPRYGWFSYPGFRLGVGILGLAGLGTWFGWWRPRQQRERAVVTQERALLRDILASRPATRTSQTLSEHVLTTTSGKPYVLLGLLGQGGMGAVYEATPLHGGDLVAIKILLGKCSIERFQREADICSRLQHPAIVKVLDWGTHQQAPFMVMERVHGTTLRDVLKSGPVASEMVTDWLTEILRGLAVAHREGIVHRDLKPENLMLTPTGHIKIMDFGVAHVDTEENLTGTYAGLGTPRYMSPEHFKARTVTPASDIFSVGMVCFELLAGANPYEGEDPWRILVRLLTEPPPDIHQARPDVPDRLAAIVNKMTAPEAERRYQTADSILADLAT